jgi:hypothetical protein
LGIGLLLLLLLLVCLWILYELSFVGDWAEFCGWVTGRNVSWVRLKRTAIKVGTSTVTLTMPVAVAGGEVADAAPTGVRYAWTDFVDCVLDNGNSSGIPAGPFRHYF